MKTKTTLAALLLAAVMVSPICSAENWRFVSLSYGQKTGFQAGYKDGYKVGKIGRELPNKYDRADMGSRAARRNGILQQYQWRWINSYVEGFFRGWVSGEVDGRKIKRKQTTFQTE